MILLDYRDKRPIYEQVVEKLERLIASGGLELAVLRDMGLDAPPPGLAGFVAGLPVTADDGSRRRASDDRG